MPLLHVTPSDQAGVVEEQPDTSPVAARVGRQSSGVPSWFSGIGLSLNPPIGLWWARDFWVGGGLGWRRVVGGVVWCVWACWGRGAGVVRGCRRWVCVGAPVPGGSGQPEGPGRALRALSVARNCVCQGQRAGYRRVGVPDRLTATAARATSRVRRERFVAGGASARAALRWPMLWASTAQASGAQFAP